MHPKLASRTGLTAALVGIALLIVAGAVLMLFIDSTSSNDELRNTRPQDRTIQEFFGNPSQSELRSREKALHDRVEQHIQACMNRADIEYTARAYQPLPGIPAGGRITFGRLNPNFKRRYGYGISTVLASRQEQEAHNHGPDRVSGHARPPVPSTAEDGVDKSRCAATAYRAIIQPMEEAEAKLLPRYRDLEERVFSHPRMRIALDAWSRCMARADYGFDSPREIEGYLLARLNMLQTAADSTNMSSSHASVMLRRLQTEERAISAVDDSCRARYLDAVEHQVRSQLEPRFVTENHELLALLRGDPRQTANGSSTFLFLVTATVMLLLMAVYLRITGGSIDQW